MKSEKYQNKHDILLDVASSVEEAFYIAMQIGYSDCMLKSLEFYIHSSNGLEKIITFFTQNCNIDKIVIHDVKNESTTIWINE